MTEQRDDPIRLRSRTLAQLAEYGKDPLLVESDEEEDASDEEKDATDDEDDATADKTDPSKPDEDAGASGLMDLPAEIRNRVYYNHFEDLTGGQPINLMTVASPAIARTSRQLRFESLPVFFAESRFFIDLEADMATGKSTVISILGVPRFARGVKKFMGSIGAGAILRHVQFRVHARIANYPAKVVDNAVLASLTVGYENKKINCTLEPVADVAGLLRGPEKWWRGKATAQDVDVVLELAKDAAEKMGARDGFKGFTLGDIDALLRVFRKMR